MAASERASDLEQTICALMAPGKGLLAADESDTTITTRFKEFSIAPTEENRRRYRELLFTTPDVEKYISGVILFDETTRQCSDDGRTLMSVLTQAGSWPEQDPGSSRLFVRWRTPPSGA